MKRAIILPIMALIMLSSFVIAADLDIKKVDRGSVIISELNNPAVFDFIINNRGKADNFEIYSLLGVSMSPKGSFDLPVGETEIPVKVYPNREIRKQSGFYSFEYEIKGQYSGIFKDTLTIKVVSLDESIEVSAQNLHPDDNEAVMVVKNNENTNLEDVKINFKSAFFETSKEISLTPYETKKMSVPLDKDEIKGLSAGAYIVTAYVDVGGAKTRLEGTLNYLEKEGTSLKEGTSGIILRRSTLTKTNEGNTPVTTNIEIKKDIISRLFTTFSSEPQETIRGGLSVTYRWEKELKPAESLSVTTTTNYTIPFVLLIVIIVVAIFAQMYYHTNVSITKRVSFVKTRGGEFAVKVRLHVKAKKTVDKIQVIDRIPGSTHVYENFGSKPDKVDPVTRRMIWNIPKLNAGEERVFSYILYSKLKIFGKFELPPATAIYEKDDKTHESFSNKTFFMSETTRSEE